MDIGKVLEDPNPFIEVKSRNKCHSPPSPLNFVFVPSSVGVKTRNRQREDCGSKTRGVGRPTNIYSRDKKSRAEIVDGSQRTLQDMGIGSPSHSK